MTEARFGVLTNGIVYRFFTDLDAPNKMDAKPFFEFDLLNYRDKTWRNSRSSPNRFTTYRRSSPRPTSSSTQRKFNAILAQQLQQPSEEFVRFFTAQVYQGRMTQAVREQFAQTTQRAFKQFVHEQVNDRLKSALGADPQSIPTESVTVQPPLDPAVKSTATQGAAASKSSNDQGVVVTTSEELEAYFTVKAILYSVVSPKRVVMRDVQSYCGVLLDDNNRKPICRLYFNSAKKAIGLFDNEERKEERVAIDSLEAIHEHADRLRATAAMYAKADNPSKSDYHQAIHD